MKKAWFIVALLVLSALIVACQPQTVEVTRVVTETQTQEVEASDRRGLLMASGLITGEALMGILVAIPIVILKQFEIELPIIEHVTGDIMPFGGIVGVGLLLIVTFWLYMTTVRRKQN